MGQKKFDFKHFGRTEKKKSVTLKNHTSKAKGFEKYLFHVFPYTG